MSHSSPKSVAALIVWLSLALLSVATPVYAAPCPPHALTPPERVQIKGDTVMIVTHATSTHDARFSTKRGVDEAVRHAKRKGIPVIYLQDDTPEQFYFMEDCAPDHWVASQGGELRFDVTADHVYLVGGHLELCLLQTANDVLFRWSEQPPRKRSITFFMDAVYTNGKLVDPSDPFYGDFQKFMAVIMYGRPQGEHWPKLSLLENMGVIVREDHELEYLKQALPRYDRTLPHYQVELRMNESVVKVIQSAQGWYPPTLRFNFIDSALNIPLW